MVKNGSLLVLCFIFLFAAFVPVGNMSAAGGSVTIAEDSVNIRSGPSLSYKLVKQVNRGEKFTIMKEEGDWIEIKLSSGKTGWVANWLVTKNGSTKASTVSKNSNATANTEQLRVRSGPGTSFRVTGYLNKGQAVEILDENENWIKVIASSGEGWVARQYIDLQEDKNESKEVTSKAIGKGTVTDLLNVRTEPSSSSSVLGKLNKGAKVTIYSQKNNWLEISFSNQKAWVSAEYVQFGTKKAGKPSGTLGTVTASTLSVRSDSSMDSSIIGSVSKGQSFMILEEENNWIKIEYQPGKYGWASGWYFNKETEASKKVLDDSKVTILENGTNIRKSPSVKSDVVLRANEGNTFPIKRVENDWFEITLPNGNSGYIAGWIVTTNGSAPSVKKQGADGYLKHKTIVIDPGHGGIDNGATGAGGTLEKELTLRTAKLLYDKLRAAGANVILTRTNDSYLPLPSRVRSANIHGADAFISLHYDSNLDSSVRGMTAYYYHSFQEELAEYVYHSTNAQTRLKSRGVREGDFHVIRETSQKAVLMELGYLSNSAEEMTITSGHFQENAATGLFNGLARYFKEN